mgnify:CR=1 FL=1
MEKKHYIGTVGTPIIVDTDEDISTATVLKLLVKKPSGSEVVWEAVLGPANAIGIYTKLQYTVQTGDWDEAGWWSIQAYVEMPEWKGPGNTVKFKLYAEHQ